MSNDSVKSIESFNGKPSYMNDWTDSNNKSDTGTYSSGAKNNSTEIVDFYDVLNKDKVEGQTSSKDISFEGIKNWFKDLTGSSSDDAQIVSKELSPEFLKSLKDDATIETTVNSTKNLTYITAIVEFNAEYGIIKESKYDIEGNLISTNYSQSLKSISSTLDPEKYDSLSYEQAYIVNYISDGTIVNIKDNNSNNIYNYVQDYLDNNTIALTSDFVDNFNENLNNSNNNYSSTEKEKLAYYYGCINELFGSDIDFELSISLSQQLMNQDSKNDSMIIHSIPVIYNGEVELIMYDEEGMSLPHNGYYLKYYNEYGINFTAPLAIIDYNDEIGYCGLDMTDSEKEQFISTTSKYYANIMKNSNAYSDKFKEVCYNNIGNISIVSYGENLKKEDYAAITYFYDETMKDDIHIRYDQIETDYSYMLGSYTHELAHVYDNHSGSISFSSSNWINYWNKAKEFDSNETLLRNYAYTNSSEGFAEMVAEYFSSDNGSVYTPNDLKALEVNFYGYENAYDYLESIVGKRGDS